MTELFLATDPKNPRVIGTIEKAYREKAEHEATLADKARQLPVPKTFHVLCAVPEVDDAYESGIVKADKTRQYEELMTAVLFVVSMGPDAYADKTRFPNGPSCAVGDFVLVRPNTGTRLKIHGREFRIISDDSVQATVQDPRGIARP
jgi:co-chaperonin GroES (HSP10)